MLSILIPAYNCENYISECIESIINQTFTDFEIIIVDDCSTDNTFNIIKKYALKDKRIKYLTNSTNLGVGVCRKKAFQESVGDFILNVDADDYLIGTNLLENVMNEFVNDDIDIVTFPFISEDKRRRYSNMQYRIITTNKENLVKIDSFATIWNKVIKRKLYDNENMFSEQRKEEPTLTYFKCIYYANKIVCLSLSRTNCYFYRKNNSSITCKADEIDFVVFFMKTQVYLYEFFKEKGITDFKHFFNLENIKKSIELFNKVKSQIKERYNKEYELLKVIVSKYQNI